MRGAGVRTVSAMLLFICAKHNERQLRRRAAYHENDGHMNFRLSSYIEKYEEIAFPGKKILRSNTNILCPKWWRPIIRTRTIRSPNIVYSSHLCPALVFLELPTPLSKVRVVAGELRYISRMTVNSHALWPGVTAHRFLHMKKRNYSTDWWALILLLEKKEGVPGLSF